MLVRGEEGDVRGRQSRCQLPTLTGAGASLRLPGLPSQENPQCALVGEAVEGGGQRSLAVDEVGAGDGPEAVSAGDVAGGVQGQWVGDAHLLGEPAGLGLGVVHGDAHEHDALVLVFLPSLLEVGHLFPARPAPGGPEIEDDHLAIKGREADLGAVESFEDEGWGWLAQFERRQVAGEGGWCEGGGGCEG